MKKLLLAVPAITVSILALSVLAFAAPASLIAQQPQGSTSPAPAAKQDAPAKPDTRINGKWHFVFQTEGGDREFEAEFTVDADGKVTGSWNGKPEAAGTYKDGHLQMAFDTFSQEANETATLKLDGQLDDSATITGNWAFSSYDGLFKATHPKP